MAQKGGIWHRNRKVPRNPPHRTLLKSGAKYPHFVPNPLKVKITKLGSKLGGKVGGRIWYEKVEFGTGIGKSPGIPYIDHF